jgi:hypothetical protein
LTTTTGEVVTGAMRLFGIIDTEEQPTTAEMTIGLGILNNMLRAEHQDAAAQYLISRFNYTIAAGQQTFQIGIASASYAVQMDVVGVRRIDCLFTPLVRREVVWSPMVDIVRTLQPGLITKAHQERQTDDSVLVSVWQIPRAPQQMYIEVGNRIAEIVETTPTQALPIPSEGIHAIKHLLGLRLLAPFGRKADDTQMAVMTAKQLEAQWLSYARNQAWVRLRR